MEVLKCGVEISNRHLDLLYTKPATTFNKELNKKYDVIGLSSSGEELEEVAQREGVRVVGVSMERRISILRDLIAFFRIVLAFMRERPYMVHSMTPKAGLLCMVAAWVTRVPVRVHTFTGLVFPTTMGLLRRVLMITDAITCYCATHVIPEGEGVKNDLLKHGITKKPLRVLGYGNGRGVDMEYYSLRDDVIRKMEELNLCDETKFTFLFVGRIVRDKGINELCHAFSLLHNQYPQTRLWLVGAYEDNLDPVSKTTKELIDNVQSGIEAVGVKKGDELLAYYAAADCFVMPSYREGFPNTVLEAGAMGLPSIVTDINGSREIIVEGQNGTVVLPKDENVLYEAMWRIINQDEWRKMMADNARKMIEDRFEQGYVRQCLYDFYDEILDGKC